MTSGTTNGRTSRMTSGTTRGMTNDMTSSSTNGSANDPPTRATMRVLAVILSITGLSIAGLSLAGSPIAGAPIAEAPIAGAPASAFARGNLHAWAFEEYDAVVRTPAERARMLKTLGLTRAGFVGRHVERMAEFDAYVAAYREQQIELVAVWTPINTSAPLAEEHIRMFLDGVARHGIKPQWWVTLEKFEPQAGAEGSSAAGSRVEGSRAGGAPDRQTVERAVAVLRPLVAKAAARGLPLALYGHGRDAWFTQPENELAIIEALKAQGSGPPVGIAYNFHHAHSQLDRFAALFPRMRPHLVALNLDGLKSAGPQILLVGDGDREQEMIALIHRSGYRGAVGLIAHQRTMDAAVVLSRNMAGLRRILTAIGDTAGASSY